MRPLPSRPRRCALGLAVAGLLAAAPVAPALAGLAAEKTQPCTACHLDGSNGASPRLGHFGHAETVPAAHAALRAWLAPAAGGHGDADRYRQPDE